MNETALTTFFKTLAQKEADPLDTSHSFTGPMFALSSNLENEQDEHGQDED